MLQAQGDKNEEASSHSGGRDIRHHLVAVQGEVRKIDEAAGKVTLKHGPIKSLGMDVGMTMTFRVKDPAMLKEVQVGDKVEFEAEQAASGYTVTKMQKSN